MEQLLLALDVEDPSLEDLNAIFRAAHSIKGGSGTFGFSDIASLTHALETLLDKLRKQTLAVTDEMISAFLSCCDLLSAMLEAHQDGSPVDEAQIEVVRAELLRLGDESVVLAEPPAASETTYAEIESVTAPIWLIDLHPQSDIFSGAASIDAVSEDLAALGQLSIINQQPNSHISWRLQGPEDPDVISEIFAFICQPAEVTIQPELRDDAVEEDEGFGFFVDEAELPAQQAQNEAEQGFGFL